MFPLPQSSTADLTLDEVIALLGRHPAVDGLLTIGSTGREALTPTSDYDLVVVLAESPLQLGVGITYIDHRLTDLLFVTAGQVEEIVRAQEPLDGEAWVGRLARWLHAGRVVFDRRGRLHAAQERVRSADLLRPPEVADAYGAWIGVNYNLLHTRRLMRSDDPVHRHAAVLRITLYGVSSVVFSYFQVRGLRWEGDKAAVRHLMAHDPAYFAQLQGLLNEADPDRKLARYEALAAATLAPLGPLWKGEPTVLWNDAEPPGREAIERGLAFWEELIRGGEA
jgi:predicted nucleotidyltransferase